MWGPGSWRTWALIASRPTSCVSALEFPREKFDELQLVDRAAWVAEVIAHEEMFLNLQERLPRQMVYERELLMCRLL